MENGFKRFLSLALAIIMVLSNVPVSALASEVADCQHTSVQINTNATCTTDGETITTCLTCNEVLSTVAAPATGHNFVDGVCACGEMAPVEVEEEEAPQFLAEEEAVAADAVAEVATYDELVAALANGGEIMLTADITVDTRITVIDGTVIDLNGKTLFINVEDSTYGNATIKNGNIVLGKDDVHVCNGYSLVNEGKTLVLNDVNMTSAEGGIKGYAVFHLKTGANLDLIDSTIAISDNEYSAGYIVYAGEATATVDVKDTTITGSKVNGIVHATTVIDNSTFTITDAVEHGINRSGVTINDSTVTISGGTGRGITAQHGNLVITGNSEVTITDMGEATIELRGDKNLTVAETATVKVDKAVNNTTTGTVTGSVTVDTTIGAVAVIGNQGYKTLTDAVKDIATDGSDTTIKILTDIELDSSVEFNYGTGKVTFTADEPVTVKQTKVGLNLGFRVAQAANIVVDKNVTFEIYDNASGMYVYYGPSLTVNGAITGGQNWGCLYLFNGEHLVSETGKVAVGRIQAGFTNLTVNGEVDTNYLLAEGATFTADGATVDANVIFDNNNGGQRWGASQFVIKNGSNVNTNKLTLSYADSTLTIDTSSGLKAAEILGKGKIIIDGANFAGNEWIIAGDASKFEGTVEIINNPDLKYEITANGIVVKAKPYVAKIGDVKFESVAAALAYAKVQSMTDVVITLIGETNPATTDSFDLIYTTLFDSVTFKQEDATKTYYLYDLYTGVRTNNGKFVFDGVNITVTDQYMFEGNVELINNSKITSTAEANCFVYYANVVVNAGSSIKGVIEDIRGGTLTIDGGKTDGTYTETPGLQDAILAVNWKDSKLVLKNGAYVKVNAANEVGRLTVNGTLEVSDSKLDSYEWIAINDGATLTVNSNSIITTQKITGPGKIVIDATDLTAGEFGGIKADLSGFTGNVEVINNPNVYAEIVNGKIVLAGNVAKIGDQGYATLNAAIEAANAGATIELYPNVTISEGAIKLPATLKNVTIKGAEGAVLKDTTISAADGNSYSYIGLTFDGLTFDNGRILLTGWRTGEETIENLTITNCTFKNLNDTTNTAPVHINKDASKAVKNFTFTNNVIDGATGGSKSGVYAQVTGKTTFTGNTINNVSFRPYVIQLTTDDGVADEFIVTGNTFSGSAVGRAQGLGNNEEGTDTVKLVVSKNIFKGITDSQQICYWNFNPETTTADLSENYYDIDILANPNKIYFNGAAANVDDLIKMGVYPYYADEAMTQEVTAPAIMVTYPKGNPVYADGKIEYYDNMLEAVPYTTNCPRLEGATITLLADVSGEGLRFMENDMVFDLNGHTYTITAGTGSQGTNTSGFQIRPEVTTNVVFKNGTIKVAKDAPVVWMFNSYATDFIVENVTVDCTNMAWGYGASCYVVVSRVGDNVQFTGNTKVENFKADVAGSAINVGGTMTIGENVVPGGTIELDAGATLTAPAGLQVVTADGYMVSYNNGVYTTVAVVAKIGDQGYATLGAALAAAKDGDIVKVFAGTYAVPSMKAGITIIGEGNVVLEGTLTGTLENLTLKNLHIKGGNAQRWAYAKGDLVFENVTFEATSVYALHFDGIAEGTNLLYKDCTIIGWAAMGGSPASCVFDGCTIKGNGTYGVIRTYFDATIKDCTFDVANVNTNDNYEDGIHAVEGAEVTVTGCTNVNGEMADIVNVHGASVVIVDGVAIQNVAKIDDNYYATLTEAFKAATSGCTIEILTDVTISEKWDCRDYATGGSHSQFKEVVTINGNGHTIKFTGTINDNNWNTVFRFEENATVQNLTIDISEATGAQRVITAKKSLTLDGLTIIGSAKYGVIFGEGSSAADLAAAEIVVKNSNLTGTRRAISDNEGGKDVKSVVITGNTLNANVYVSASDSITFTDNTASGEVDLRSYAAQNVLAVTAQGNTLNTAAKNFISAKTIDAQSEFAMSYAVANKAELNAALSAAQEGDTIILTADIDYGTDQLAITKAITLDLGGKTLTTRNAWGGMSIKCNPTVKNGTIVHASNTAAIKVWNATAFEDLVIDVQGKGDANKVIGGIVLQSGSTTRVGSIKNVTIKGAALTNGIETYNCGDATENVIGSMENVTIDAIGTGMLISAPCGTATNCSITGGTNGIEIWIKGNYSASLALVNSKVEGRVYAHDEFTSNPDAVNNGTLSLTVDSATTGVSEEDITLTIARANEDKVEGILETIITAAEAKVNDTYYATLAEAMAAAKAGDTVKIFAGEYDYKLSIDKAITVIGEGKVTLNGVPTIKGNGYKVENINFVYGTGSTNLSGSGLIKNCSFTATDASGNTFRYCYGTKNGEITFEGCTLNAPKGWAIHFDSAPGMKLIFTNCEINGRVALGGDLGSLTATGTTFKTGYVNVWGTETGATFTECEFVNVPYIYTGSNADDVVNFNKCDDSVIDLIYGGNDSAAAKIYVDGVLMSGAAKIGNVYYNTVDEAFAAAKDKDEVVILKAGTYKLGVSGKNITVTGAVSGVVFDNIGAYGMNGASVTFNNVTFNYGNENYKGLQHSGELVYNNCTFNGQVFLYGQSETFVGCTFNQTSADAYNVWTYGAKEVAFNECIFNSAGKSVLVYAESASISNQITVTNTKFNASAAVDGKAAIEIDTSLTAGATITVDAATTATGFGKGNVSGNSLWNNKKGNNTDATNDLTVKVGDKTVLAPVTFVAYIGKTGYTTIDAAVKAAVASNTVTIMAGTYNQNLTINKAITVVGQIDEAATVSEETKPGVQHTNLVNINGNVTVGSGATVKNLNVHNVKTGTYDCALDVNGSDIVLDGVKLTGYNGMRYCYAKGDITIKNSTIDASYFALHFDGSNGGNLVIDNCDITGWISYGGGIDKVTLKDSTFDAGSYAGQRSYADALVIEGSTFEAGYKLDIAVTGSTVTVTESKMSDGSDIATLFNGDDVVANDFVVDNKELTYVAAIGNTYYQTLAKALAAVTDYTSIKLVADATLDYTARDVYGRDTTTDIIIDGQGFTLTLNQTNSDWASIGLKNADGKLVLKNMTIEKTGHGDINGAWNKHAIIFSSNVEMKDVTVNNAIAVQNGATLNNVTINEAGKYYGLWINGNGQNVNVNGGAINATNGGRGIKIADQYIDAPASVTLSVTGTDFNTAEKAAVLVSSTAGAKITATNVDISGVVADPVNFAWVDEDWAADYNKVTVNGAPAGQEGIENFTAAIVDAKGNVIGYYADITAAVNDCTEAGNYTIKMLADYAEDVTILQKEGVNIVIDGDGKTFSGTMNIHGGSNYGSDKLTIQNVQFETNEKDHDFIWSDDGKDAVKRYAHNVTVKDCDFTATGAGKNTAVALRIRQAKNIDVINCSASGMHSLMQVNGGSEYVVDNASIVNCKNGVSFSQADDVTVKDSYIKTNGATGYGIRGTGYTGYTLNVESCDVNAYIPVLVRKTTGEDFTLNVTGDNSMKATNKFVTGGAWAVICANDASDEAPKAPTGTYELNVSDKGLDLMKIYPQTLKGSGTETDPYQIGTKEELILFRDSVNAGENKYSAPGVCVVLTADIDLAGENWVGIGSINQAHGFMGNFDGNGFKIKNLTITNPALDSDGYAYAGLFSITEGTDKDNQNVIKNLTIENVTISTTGHIVSAAIAYPYYTKVENVTVCGDINITGGDYTSGVLAYTRRCVDAKNLSVEGNAGSTITGEQVVGGVISDIQMNGGLTANYSNFSASGVTITGEKQVGGISGIIATQTLNGATVKNVELVSADARVGIVSGSLGGTSTITNVVVENVTGATAIIGAAYDGAAAVQAKIGDTYYATFEAAYAAAKADETITLLAPIVVAKGETLTLDKAVNIEYTSNVVGEDMITNRGTVNISAGKITYINTDTTGSNVTVSTISSEAGSVLNITGGTVENKTVYSTGSYAYAIDLLTNGNLGDVTATISGGKVYSDYMAIRQFNNGTACKNTLTVTGGEIYGAKRAIQVHLNNTAAYTTISGGKIEAGENGYALCNFAANNDNLSVTGGEFIGTVYSATNGFISGGTFTVDPADYVADGYMAVKNNETYGVNVNPAYGKVAKIGNTYYATLADAIAAIEEGNVVIELVDNAELSYGAREAYGIDATTSVTIDGNGYTLTLNQTNSDWGSIGLKNADAKLVLNEMTINKSGKGATSGAWNTHAIIFSNNVEMNDVIVSNSVAVQNGATLNNVTINEANGYYGLWINGNGQTVTVNGGAINATNGGRGIKIADQYVDAPASVTLKVEGTKFTTAKKAAILVSSTAGADITANNVDITNVTADSTNVVWVDEDWAANYGNVTVTGASVAQENLPAFTAATIKNDAVQGYYKTLAEAVTAGDSVRLLANVTDVIVVNKAITVDANNFTANVELAIGGTVTAPENSLTVTTDIAGHKVIYANGVYSVVAKDNKVMNVNDGEQFETLAEAIAAAKAGDTIKLLANFNESVTVNKNLTIDGDEFNYTGTMTIDGGKTVTVKNVNFVKGSIDTVKNTQNKLTIENCDFDGVDNTINYAVTMRGGSSITIVDCTAKHYLYDMLWVPNAVTNVTVQDTQVTECRAAVNVAYGTNITLDNVTTSAVEYGIQTHNYGAKTITIRNCDLEGNYSVRVYDRENGARTTDTFIFEGKNIIRTLSNSKYAKYVLNPEKNNVNKVDEAILITPEVEGLEITTYAADYKVVYDTAAYKLVKKNPVAQIGEAKFESLAEAFEAAQNGDTITMIADHVMDGSKTVTGTYGYDNLIVNGKSVTLDFAGYTVEVTPNCADANGGIAGTLESVIFLTNDAELTLVDKTGKGGFYVKAGTDLYSLIYNNGSTLVINGGNYYVEKTITAGAVIYADIDQKTTINGGVFTLGNAGEDSNSTKPWLFNVEGKNDGFVHITGGYFNQNPYMNFGTAKDCEIEIADDKCFVKITEGEFAGYWTLESAVAYNVQKGINYATVTDALNAAANGQTVKMLTSSEVDILMVPAGVKLDLNGQMLTAANVLSFGNVIDNTQGKGGIKISNDKSKAFVQLQQNNVHMPLYDAANGCYRFYEYKLNVSEYVVGNGYVEFMYKVRFADISAYALLADTANSGLKISVNLSWNDSEGKMTHLTYNVRPETIANYAENCYDQIEAGEKAPMSTSWCISVRISGLEILESGTVLTGLHSVTSETGAAKHFEILKGGFTQYIIP